MDANEIKKYAAELKIMLTHATAALTTIQGIEVGFFDWIPTNKTITAQELSGQMGYDISKVERWLRFGAAAGYLSKSAGGYTLTTKGVLLRKGSPIPDLLGLHHMVSYFTKALPYSKDAFQKGVGLDSITQGKISRDYIPRVASQLSQTSAEFFKWSGLSTGHTILDLGCGDGSVLRETVKACPGISATGIDINPHTLELGRRKNTEAGLQDQIELHVGDVTDLSGIKDNAFDWVYAINVFHFLPSNKREKFLREMVRISRYGIFFNQNITNSIGTYSVDVLLSTLFTDYTGFFTEAEADELIRKMNLKQYTFLPIIQGESRLAAMFTSKNDVPLSRLPKLSPPQQDLLTKNNIRTAKDVLIAETSVINGLGIDVEALRASAIKLLFP
jgi:ubiquinone/menaquinone biosynthesis C-methylase UbiE